MQIKSNLFIDWERSIKMKKILLFITLLLSVVVLNSCTIDDKVSVIVPSGTPSLGVANALEDDCVDYEVVVGSDALVSAFTNSSHDIIIAPVNLGAKFFNSLNEFNYVFYQTIVGGNFYLLSTNQITNIKDLDNQSITVFGANSTPDVLMRSLISYYKLNVEINYVSDVSEANAMLVAGKATTIVTAEPSASKINGSKKYWTLSLQDEWKKMAGEDYKIPQAGIFVKKDKVNTSSVKTVLKKMNESLSLASTSPMTLAQSGIRVDETLAKLGEALLIQAIPNCNFVATPTSKTEVEFYFNWLIKLGLGKTIGGALPNETFYTSENAI